MSYKKNVFDEYKKYIVDEDELDENEGYDEKVEDADDADEDSLSENETDNIYNVEYKVDNGEPQSSDITNDFQTESAIDSEDSDGDQYPTQLLYQGAYGCAYYPYIDCEGEIGTTQYLTKVQYLNDTLKNELACGKQIQNTIKNMHYYYAPLLSSCKLKFERLKELTDVKKCDLFIKKDKETGEKKEKLKSTNVVSTKIRYVGSNNLDQHLKKLYYLPTISNKCKMRSLVRIIDKSLQSLDQLNRVSNLIHYDVKFGNIVYDPFQHTPIIIDFGLSFNILDIENETSAILYTDKYYPFWGFESFLASNLIKELDAYGDNLDISITNKWYLQFVNSFFENLKKSLFDKNMFIETNGELKQYADQKLSEWYATITKRFIKSQKIKSKKLLRTLIQPNELLSWDAYGFSVSILYSLDDWHRETYYDDSPLNESDESYSNYIDLAKLCIDHIMQTENRDSCNELRMKIRSIPFL